MKIDENEAKAAKAAARRNQNLIFAAAAHGTA